MGSEMIMIQCSWNGKWEECHRGMKYIGGREVHFYIQRGGTYDELLATICNKCGVDVGDYDIKVVARLQVCRDGMWECFTIRNDTSLEMAMKIWDGLGIAWLDIGLEMELRQQMQQNTTQMQGCQTTERMASAPSCRPQVRTLDSPIIRPLVTSLGLSSPVTVFGECNVRSVGAMHANSSGGCHHSEDNNCNVAKMFHQEGDSVVERAHVTPLDGNFFRNEDEDVDALDATLEASGDEDDCDNDEGGGPHVQHASCPVPKFSNVDLASRVVWDNEMHGLGDVYSHVSGKLQKGLRFHTKENLMHYVKACFVRDRRMYVVSNSDSQRWSIKCKLFEMCSWRLRASRKPNLGYWEIVVLKDTHSCVNANLSADHRQLDSSFLAHVVKCVVEKQPDLAISMLQQHIVDVYQYRVSYRKAWDAKQRAIALLFGDWEKSYNDLYPLMRAISRANPGTIYVIQTSSHPLPGVEVFSRMFWSFGSSISGWQHCRPVINIDGTQLCGKYKGSLLVAMGVDGNDRLFPLAFAIVEGENTDSWGWFLVHLRSKVVKERSGVCLISDSHSGILNAMDDPANGWCEPMGYHRYCTRHLANNLNTHFKNERLKFDFYQIAMENELHKWTFGVQQIYKTNPEACTWISQLPVEKWSLAHDGGCRWGYVNTNLSEVFNGVLKGAGSLPITALVEKTFYEVAPYFAQQNHDSMTEKAAGHEYTPAVRTQLAAYDNKSNLHMVTHLDYDGGIFDVRTARNRSNDRGPKHHQVRLNSQTCSCQKWQLRRYPCSHAIAAFKSVNLDWKQHVNHFYSLDACVETWKLTFEPIEDKAYWPPSSNPTLVPDPHRRRATRGRPRSSKLYNGMDPKEGYSAVQCSLCRQKGHNCRSCPTRCGPNPPDANPI